VNNIGDFIDVQSQTFYPFWLPEQMLALRRAWQQATPLDWGGMILRPGTDCLGSIAQIDCDVGIYALTERDGHLLYIGQSINIPMRIAAHWKKGAIPFAGFVVQPVPEYALNEVEFSHIHALEPECNAQYRGCFWPGHEAMVKAIRQVWYETEEVEA